MSNLPPIEIDPKTFLSQHYSLPALPRTLTKIQEIIREPDTEMSTIVELISSDPALVAQLLKVVNSSYYALPTEVSQIQFAVAFLGLNEVYRMVLSLTVINTLNVEDALQLKEFWFHSYYTSLCTKYLAKKYEPQLSFEDLWSASVLHDIGKLVYLKFFPKHYAELKKYMQENGCLLSEATEHFSLPSDTYFGALLCDHWRLPEKIKDACEFHTIKDLDEINAYSPTGAFKKMVCLGNLVSILSKDELNDAVKRRLADAIMKALDCSDSGFLSLMGDIYELRLEVDKFMHTL
jgi:HD-like signal output (HDOD) protein